MRLFEFKQMPFDSDPNIGWWRGQDPLRMYHGTNIANLESVLDNGIANRDPDTGLISLAFDPNTARGYASMSGGEANFRRAGAQAEHVPVDKRVTIVMDIPWVWIERYMDPRLGGNIGDAKEKLLNKELYDNYDGPDYAYYALTELRVDMEVPANYIVGYML